MSAALPVHGWTGLQAIGWRRNGAPIWPIMGGDGTGETPVTPPVPAPPVPTPPPTPVVAPFDPASLSPEAQAYLKAQEQAIAAREGGKARETARENARKEALADLAKAWGAGDAPVDPAAAAAELSTARAEARALKIDKAIDTASRGVKADGDLVAAVLAHAGKLKDLDPAADGFADAVKVLVEETVKNKPQLLLAAPTAVGGQAPVNGGFGGQPTTGERPSLGQAVANWATGSRR